MLFELLVVCAFSCRRVFFSRSHPSPHPPLLADLNTSPCDLALLVCTVAFAVFTSCLAALRTPGAQHSGDSLRGFLFAREAFQRVSLPFPGHRSGGHADRHAPYSGAGAIRVHACLQTAKKLVRNE